MENTKEIMSDESKKQRNVKLYPIYKMFSWDLLFYYAIIFLFFTEVKGIQAADVVLAESLYPFFKVLLLMPVTILIGKIGKRKSLIIANLSLVASTTTYIFATNFQMVLLGEFFCAIGYITKGICETNMLYDSLEKNEKRGVTFSKIDGKAISMYYYIDAISAVVSGFLFVINGYLPMILCLLINIVSVVMAINFEEIDSETIKQKEKVKISTEFKELRKSLKNIVKSPRLRNLLIFGALFSGLLGVLVTLRSSLLRDIQVPAQYFGVIFAMFGIISGIAAKNQHKIHNRFRNRTLASISLPVVITCIFLGLWCSIGLNYAPTLLGVLIIFLIHYISNGPFHTLIRQYLNNFTTSSLRNKISALYNMAESFFRAMIGFFASFLLRYTTTAISFVIIGCISTVVIVLMLDNMREKVGLKPEEYKEKDTKILELK